MVIRIEVVPAKNGKRIKFVSYLFSLFFLCFEANKPFPPFIYLSLRYIELLKKDLIENPADPRPPYYIGQSYFGMPYR